MNKDILIDGEKAYPIYRFSIKWIQDENTDNGTSLSLLKLEEMSDFEIISYIDHFWETYSSNEKFNGKNPRDMSFTYELYFETWNLTHFSHETFDVGQSDENVLASFEKYVRRHESYQEFISFKRKSSDTSNVTICLMGAEDRYRWRGADNEKGETTEAPCRCQNCKDAKLIRINH